VPAGLALEPNSVGAHVQPVFIVNGQDCPTMRLPRPTKAAVCLAGCLAVCLGASVLLPAASLAAQLAPLQCLTTDETREEIASARLVQPLVLMRRAAGDLHAEAVDGRLCRWNNELIYEISLLRRDGHIVRVLYNAANGKAVEGR
jgi:hypothetical protein